MADELKERAEKSSLDHMVSTAQSALVMGASAAFLYRGGGKNFLAKGVSVSSRVLNETNKEFAKLSMKNLTTKDLKGAFNTSFRGEESILKKALSDAENQRFRLRGDSQQNLVGILNHAMGRLVGDPDNQIIRPMFNQKKVVAPTANEFMKKLGKDDDELKRRIGQFTEEAFRNLDDLNAVLNRQKALKLDKDITRADVDDILAALKAKVKEEEPNFNPFSNEYKKNAIEQALDMAVDPKAIARVAGTKDSPDSYEKFLQNMLGDRAATVDEIIANREKFVDNKIISARQTSDGKGKHVSEEAVDFLVRMRAQAKARHGNEAAAEFGKLNVDSAVRINKSGEFSDFTETVNATNRLADSFASTMPGKIFKVRDFRERSKAPEFEFFAASSLEADPVLARLTNKQNTKSMLTEDSFFRIYDKSFRIESKGLSHEKALDDTYLLSSYGAVKGLRDKMAGNEAYKVRGSNWLFDKLNIGKEGQPTLIDDVKTRFSKFENPEWIGNVIPKFTNRPTEVLSEIQALRGAEHSQQKEDAINSLLNQAKAINNFYSKNTFAPSSTAALRLSENMSGEAKETMTLLTMRDEDMLSALIEKRGSDIADPNAYSNQDLISLLREYKMNPMRAKEMLTIKESQGNAFGGNQSAGFYDLLRTELAKESFLQHAKQNAFDDGRKNYDSIADLIDSTVLSKEAKRETRRLSDWSVFQDAGEVHSRFTKGRDTLDELIDASERVANLFVRPAGNVGNASYMSSLKKNLEELKSERVSIFDTDYNEYMENTDLVLPYRSAEWTHMKKAVSPMDLIKNINDAEMRKAFFKQATAGRNNLEDVTTATMIPYFFGVRLSDALSKIGLSFGVEDKASIGSLTQAMVFKRGLPIVGGMAAYDYISDMTGVLTGTTASAALASGVANVDLGFRSLTDTFGITEFLKDEKEINPFYRYWTGDEYMSREEREDWYQNGYQEMRKSRWWNFGGISEFRGSEIQYYQPNYLRRISSNWKDKALYDSVWEKWSHSWIPTPTNPISPLIYLADPYYMERKFEDERPYPMTGKMFTEETPWGPILNSTVGELIKPQRRMHTDRLDENFVDSKAIIESENMAIYEKARGDKDGHLIRFKDGSIEPVSFTGLDAPTPSTRAVSIRSFNGEVQQVTGGGNGYGDFSGVQHASALLDSGGTPSGSSTYAGGGSGGSSGSGASGYQEIEGLSFEDELMVKAAEGSIISGLIGQAIGGGSLEQLKALNEDIYNRARENQFGSFVGMPREKGVITAESIYKSGARFGSSVLDNSEALSDLKGLSAGDDFIGEMAYASRFAAGIYGYGAFRMFPGEPSTKLSDASDITSPVRSFWDANTGGLGGGYLEIFRRFIPAANHKQEDFNPLLNTMPDWMPERFRFGDPFTALPKGEMRMPGRGYEALNDLHPDQYGMYGAFDRFKILADIAPTSHEYKVWRDIATKTVKDQLLKEEINEIRDRVTEQNKSFDFFHYKFLGQGVDRERVVVDKVMNNNYFTVVGDNRVFRMAGINVGGGENQESILSQHLISGTEIVLTTDKNQYNGVNDDEYNSVNAAVFADGININKLLVDEGYATERKKDISAAATMANFTGFQIMRGKAWEALSHLPVPYFQQKFFKVRDPLESYKHEMVYGTPYASWTNPIDSFLKTGFERSLMSDGEMIVGVGGMVANKLAHNYSSHHTVKTLANGAYMLSNRGAFIGGFLAIATGNKGKPLRMAMDLGAAAQAVGWAVTRSDQPIEGTIGATAIGAAAGHILKDVGIKKGAAIGAITGAIVTGARSSILEDGLDKTWVPERTREKWELQEYFDRLEYVKYKGLYEKAARKAKLHEGTDIKEIVDNYEKSREKNLQLRERLEDAKDIIQSTYALGDERAQRLLGEIEGKLKAIEESEFTVTAGDYGRSALIYKQAMDSTIYGLDKDASWAQLLRSIPAHERDHFMEFAKVQDPDKREEILKYVSPYLAKVLKISWGEEYEKLESNESYFKNMYIPPPTWSGWKPGTDLNDVQVKTIQNEGMHLADFGFYESQLRDKDVINAPSINPESSNNPIEVFASLSATLKGMGLVGVNVNVSPSSQSGIQVAANIVNGAINAPAMVESKIKQMLSF